MLCVACQALTLLIDELPVVTMNCQSSLFDSWEFVSFCRKIAPMYGCLACFVGSGFLHNLKPQVDDLQQNSIYEKPIENYT
jgi:hypothetical protein